VLARVVGLGHLGLKGSLTAVRVQVAVLSLAVTAGLCAAAAWVFSWPLEKAVYLAPIIVAAAGASVGLLIFWGRVVFVQVRDSPNRRLLLWLGAGFLLLVGVLTALGVELPRE
jgi:hypothetical protein